MEAIMATHTIKPSSPTPIELKTHKLSSLDQLLSPPIYLPLIFFYHNHHHSHSDISRLLRQSLSETLSIFYPLAGTRHSSFVDCNDRGAEFVEARVHARLAQFLQAPKMEEINKLVSVDCNFNDDTGALLLVKLSYFDCGGISVGVCFSHRIGDTSSFVGFMTAWAATCRRRRSGGGGETTPPEIIHPSFDMARYFPPRDSSPASGLRPPLMAADKISTTRLVFDGEQLEKLRNRDPRPSRVEAVSVFIWRSFIANSSSSSSSPPPSVFHAVNLRPRMVPPVPDQTFGNCTGLASAVASHDDGDDVDALVSKLRAAIRAVDGDYINKVLKDDSFLRAAEEGGGLCKPGDLVFSSWARFPVYEVDFGWGKPAWVCPTGARSLNIVILMSTADGEGMEAWISTDHDNLFTPSST